MEKEGNTLIIKSDSKIKIPKFISVYSKKHHHCNTSKNIKNILTINKKHMNNNDITLSEEEQKEIEDIVNQIDNPINFNIFKYFAKNTIKNKDTSLVVLELLNILNQPIDNTYPKKRFIPNKTAINQFNLQDAKRKQTKDYESHSNIIVNLPGQKSNKEKRQKEIFSLINPIP